MARLPKRKYSARKSKHSTASSSASGNANRSNDGSNVTMSTLSMISTPWSTESGFTPVEFTEYPKPLCLSRTPNTYTFSWSSADPLTTTASTVLQSLASCRTVTLLKPTTPCASVRICLPKKPSTTTLSSWTVETFTSEGFIFSDNLSVKHLRSPGSSGTDYYPCSSDTLVSRKGSRASISPASSKSEQGDYFPLNYINRITLNPQIEEHLGLDWTFAKEHGIPIVISVPI